MSEKTHAIIAGAGIGGLTAALALSRAGFRVSVLERAAMLDEVGAGLQLSANATSILRDLGLLERLHRVALTPEALHVRRASDGTQLMRMPFGALAETRWGAPHLVVHRADLQRLLLEEAARSPDISVETNTEVLGFTTLTGGIQVGATRNGEQVRYDGHLLIGADGLRSTVRERLGLGLSDRPVYSGRSAWRALLPAQNAPAFALMLASNLWLGPRAHLVHYPLRGGDVVNIVAIVEDRWRGDDDRQFWQTEGDAQFVRARFANWHADAQELIGAVKEWRRWPLFDRNTVDRWALERAVLLGDAAHPVLPFLAQGAALAIEDAAEIGLAASRHGSNIAALIRAYQARRIRRASDVVLASRRQGSIYHLSNPLALARDMVMRRLSVDAAMARMDWLYGYRA
ncbi:MULTISPECIES: FAD-dependent monooxygenase [unclassified Beijerinckia]|uniref:FAD-dependent monooxygenase n=1 Tax=unclassified Beijerinckia TaxID=2638183 RepID=UPI001FCD3992|nr:MULTISPECIES: FAD-dependent monooxygenase [unclassified Beijerinckia]